MKKTTSTQTESAVAKKKKLAKAKALKVKSTPVLNSTEEFDTFEDQMEQGTQPMQKERNNKIFLVIAVVILVLGYGVYKYKSVLTPAVVNGQPIYVWDYLWQMHKQYGQDQLNAMTTELMIEQAVKEAKVSVSAAEIDGEVKTVEQEASSSGGLQTVLEAQHLSMDQFKTRIRLQLAVKKILADKVKVTDQEVEDTYKKSKDLYKSVAEATARQEIKKQLEDQKFQTEVTKWLTDVRQKAKVEIKAPGL